MQKIYTHPKLLYLYMYNFYDLNIIFGYTTTPVFWQYVYKITISTVAIFLIRKKEIISTITFKIAIIDFFAIRKQLVTISQKRPDYNIYKVEKSHCLPQRLKSIFFENFSNGFLLLKHQKSFGFWFSIKIQPLIHTFIIELFSIFRAL